MNTILNNKNKKLAVLTTSVVYYEVPIFRRINETGRVDIVVYYSLNLGAGAFFDPQLNRIVEFTNQDVLSGYKSKFLRDAFPNKSTNAAHHLSFSIIREIYQNKFDAIWIDGWNSLTNWLAFFGAIFMRTKILLRSESPMNQEVYKTGFKSRIKRVLLKQIFKKISAFLYIGEENKKFYKSLEVPDSKLFFTPYAVDNNRFFEDAKKYLPKREEIRQKLNIGKETKVVLFVGKLIEKKRPLDLLMAYERLEVESKAIIFVGDGDLREGLEEYVVKKNLRNVHFVGFKNQVEISEYYSAADVFVLPSGMGETWGLVVNEAMCFGLPIIVSSMVGCGSDLVRCGENGYIFKLGDFRELSNLIKLVLESDKTQSLKEKSLEIVRKYSYEEDVRGIEKAINT